MRRLLPFILFIFIGLSANSQCTLSMDTIVLDTTMSDCNHLFFKYKISGGTPSGFEWDYGDGNTCTCIHPKNVYSSNGTFNVCAKVRDANGCRDSMCISVKVNCSDPCDLSGIGIYSLDTLSYSCNEYEFVTITSQNAKTIDWDFGDGNTSNTKFTTHQYSKNGIYPVRLIIKDSIQCADTADIQIVVNCPEVVDCDFEITDLDSSNGDSCLKKLFNVSSNKGIKTIQWDLGDGTLLSTGLSIQHEYKDTGVYNVCVIAGDSSDCKDTMCIKVAVRCDKKTKLNGDELSTIQIYPNPFEDHLYLSVDADFKIKLSDASGRLLIVSELSEGLQMIDVSNLIKGVYVLQVESEGRITYYKLVK
ncbi:MAG TPA: PKD domain-containing protein [Bacteroidia bacterium]